MASTARVLAAEYILAVGISSYGAVKSGFVPWPAAVIRIGIGFGLLGLLAAASPELAVMLGGGFLLADVLKLADPSGGGGWAKTFGAVPPPPTNGDYYSLGLAKAPEPFTPSISGGTALGVTAKPSNPAPVQPPSLLPGTVFQQ